MPLFRAEYCFEQVLESSIPTFQDPFAGYLEFLFLFLANEGDILVTRNQYSEDYLSYLDDHWGLNTKERVIFDLAQKAPNWWFFNRDINIERYLNSKKTSWEFCRYANIDQDFLSFWIDQNLVKEELRKIKHIITEMGDQKWVLKKEFGFSARGNKLLSSEKALLLIHRGEIERALLEPWVKRTFDFGLKIDKNKNIYYELLNTNKGSFQGARLIRGRNEDFDALKNQLISFLGTDEYFPIQIDGFDYKSSQGETKRRMVSEINHRITMVDLLHHLASITRESSAEHLILRVPLNPNLRFTEILDRCFSYKKTRVRPLSDMNYRYIFIYAYLDENDSQIKSDLFHMFL